METTNLLQLKVLAIGLRFEIQVPTVKYVRGGVLKPAKRITGLRTNDKAKHLAAVEKMIAALDAEPTAG